MRGHILCFMFLLQACPSKGGTSAGESSTTTNELTTTTTAGTTTSTTTAGTTTESTTSTASTGGGFPAEVAEGCGFPRPCTGHLLLCGNDAWMDGCTADFTAETLCALTRLAAGEAFAFRFDLNGFNGEEEWLDIVFDGQGGAVAQDWLEDPNTFEAAPNGPPQACTLRSTADFQACLDAPNDDPLHAQCMLHTHWFTSCVGDANLMCPDP